MSRVGDELKLFVRCVLVFPLVVRLAWRLTIWKQPPGDETLNSPLFRRDWEEIKRKVGLEP